MPEGIIAWNGEVRQISEFFKLAGGLFADRAAEIIGQRVRFVDITADGAAIAVMLVQRAVNRRIRNSSISIRM